MREKLIELMKQSNDRCDATHCGKCEYRGKDSFCEQYRLADYLIENGVVIPVRCPICRDMRIKPFTLETFCSRTGETVYRDGYCIYGKPREKDEE